MTPNEFDCGCGRHIVRFVGGPKVCAFCQAFGPRRGKALQDWHDGLITEGEMLEEWGQDEETRPWPTVI